MIEHSPEGNIMAAVDFGSVSGRGSRAGIRGRLTRLFADCSELFVVFGAACRVSWAVEVRKQPTAADLKILGIKGPLALPL